MNETAKTALETALRRAESWLAREQGNLLDAEDQVVNYKEKVLQAEQEIKDLKEALNGQN